MKREARPKVIFLHLGDQSIEEDTKNGEDDPKNTRNLFGLESFKSKDGSIVWGISGGVMAQCIPVAHPRSSSFASPVAYASTWTKKNKMDIPTTHKHLFSSAAF